ncbi:MAG: nicotinate-nucleotide adenylyltransferase [Dorea sp.]
MIENGIINARFQVLHLKHMEYILAAKMRCSKLWIGISNPDPYHTKGSVNDENRGTKSANPLTYFERCEMIKGALAEFKVPEHEYEIVPFPIDTPEYIPHYIPKDAVHFMGLCDAWDEEKYTILKDLGCDIEVLWRRPGQEKGITGSWVRSCIATDHEWAHMVPKSVYRYLTENELDKRIKRLELMRIEEKQIM